MIWKFKDKIYGIIQTIKMNEICLTLFDLWTEYGGRLATI